MKKERRIGIVITIWHGMTIQGLYCYLDMGNNTVTYHKCSHVPNLIYIIIYILLYMYMHMYIASVCPGFDISRARCTICTQMSNIHICQEPQ